MKKFSCLISFVLVMIFSCSAHSSQLGGRPLKSVDDVFAVTGKSAAVKKDSLLIIHNRIESNAMVSSYNVYTISPDGGTSSFRLKNDDNFGTNAGWFRGGLPVAVSTNYQTSTLPPSFVYSKPMNNSERIFEYYADVVSNDGSKTSSKRAFTAKSQPFSASNYPDVVAIKSGIFVPGSPREIFAFATVWDYPLIGSVFRIDLFSMSGDVKDFKYETSINLDRTSDSGHLMRIAAGNFTGSGRRDIAVIANNKNKWGYDLNVYSLNWTPAGKLDFVQTVKDERLYTASLHNRYKILDEWFYKAAGDIAMADFDGDGLDEIAAVYKGFNESLPKDIHDDLKNMIGALHVEIIKYDSTAKSNKIRKTSMTKSYSSWESQGMGFAKVKSLGDLRITPADIDGDGKSELAVLAITWATRFDREIFGKNRIQRGEWSAHVDIFSFNSKLKPSFLRKAADLGNNFGNNNFYYDPYYKDINPDIFTYRSSLKKNTFTDQAFQIISGAFTGVSNTETNKTCEDIAVSCASYEEPDKGAWVRILQPKFNEKGTLSSFNNYLIFEKKKDNNITIGLAAGDFTKTGILLKNPVHWIVDNQKVFTAIVPSPPYHVDYIPVPWNESKEPSLVNISFVPDTTVNYTRSTTTQDKQDISSAFTSTYEMKTDIAAAWSLGVDLLPTNDAKFNPRFSVQVTGNIHRLGKDLEESTKTTLDTKQMTLSMTSGKSDNLMLHQVRQHIWRYPIEPIPSWYKPRSVDISATGQLSYTVTMSEQPSFVQGNYQGYRARHEEGNLFSYPTKLDNIQEMKDAKSAILSERITRAFSPTGLEYSLKLDKSITSGDSTTRDVTIDGGFGVSVMVGKADLGSTGGRVTTTHQWGGNWVDKKVLTKTYTKGDSINVKFSNPSVPPSTLKQPLAGKIEDVAFNTEMQVYSNPQGILTLGFAVDLMPNGNGIAPILWRESVYNEKPDPSFVLPDKFSFTNGKWAANTDKLRATSMRGILYYDLSDDKKMLDNEILNPGKTYQISIPVYNASFLPAENVKVTLSYLRFKDRNTPSKAKKIGEAVITLDGWKQGSEGNKTYANFNFKIPATINHGQYLLMAEIDPDNEISEVHEAWSKNIPGGNNTGCATFVISPSIQPGANTGPKRFEAKAKVKKSNVRASLFAAADSDTDEYEYQDASRVYSIASVDSEDTEITLEVQAVGNFEFSNALFEIVQYSSGDEGVVIDSDTYYVMPDDNTYEAVFTLSDAHIKNGDDLRLEITTEDGFFSIPLSNRVNDGSTDSNNSGSNQESNTSENYNDDDYADDDGSYNGVGSANSGCNGFSGIFTALALFVIFSKRK